MVTGAPVNVSAAGRQLVENKRCYIVARLTGVTTQMLKYLLLFFAVCQANIALAANRIHIIIPGGAESTA